jgi:signal transduction histidine kinase
MLMSLIDDILDLSKIEAGTFVINNFHFEISELINEVKDLFSYQCQQKKIKFWIHWNQILKYTSILSDKGRIKQILLNLISNALKFTFEGSITVSISQELKNGKEIIEFSVEDTGIGIKEEHKPKLFTLFGMIEEGRQHNLNGTGIGLTISKKYWEKLGGGVSLDSEFGKGTIVSFWIPMTDSQINESALFEE